jgi:hypothetical protein
VKHRIPTISAERTEDAKELLSACRTVLKKAEDWFGNDALVSDVMSLTEYEPPIVKMPDGTLALALVEIGRIAELAYYSNKYDGKNRLWAHEVTGDRRLFISADGSTLVVWPPFKVTKRGIEG